MKLWRVYQTVNTDYDTWDGFVCAAETEEDARNMLPSGGTFKSSDPWGWVTLMDDVQVEYLGEAKPDTDSRVILASFNAG